MYKLEITNDAGEILSVAHFPTETVRAQLIHRYYVDSEQIDFALEVIHASGSTFDLCIIENIQNEERIVWTGRLSYCG